MKAQSPVIYLVDDDPSVLKAVTRLLNIEGFETRPFKTPRSFLDQHDPSIPGCIILDVAMPELTGLELQRRLSASPHGQPIIFISGHSDVPTSVEAMKGGAVDFLTKPFSDDALLTAIRNAIRKDEEAREALARAEDIEDRLAKLTPRERAVFAHVVAGRLNKQIASDLGIVEKTVKVHRARMMKKMRVCTVAELVKLAERLEPSG